MKVEKTWAMPSKYTFDIKPIHDWLLRRRLNMDAMLEIKMLENYIEKLEEKIRHDHGDKPAIHVWLDRQMQIAGLEAMEWRSKIYAQTDD